MTTKGVQKLKITHGVPDGSRNLTARELAAFQGFYHDHIFRDTKPQPRMTPLLTMIGNAYPSIVAKVVFDSVREQLEKTDRVELRHVQSRA
jgi:site-specific DNA-cytosine methylase